MMKICKMNPYRLLFLIMIPTVLMMPLAKFTLILILFFTVKQHQESLGGFQFMTQYMVRPFLHIFGQEIEVD